MPRILTFIALITATVFADTIQYSPVSREVVEARLTSYVTKNDRREPALRKIFEDAGCRDENLSEQSVKSLKAPNLVCAMKGSLDGEIVVGAHFDLVTNGDGVVDNWTGASLLPSLYEGFAHIPRRHTFLFVAFSGEEEGLVGSKAFVGRLNVTHENVRAMVNMDTLGLAETEVWTSHADPTLLRLIQVAAATTNLPLSGMNVDAVRSTDSESFREKKIPAITIHSLTLATLSLLHSPKDRIEAVHREEYYRTYRLVLAYLAVLDQKLE